MAKPKKPTKKPAKAKPAAKKPAKKAPKKVSSGQSGTSKRKPKARPNLIRMVVMPSPAPSWWPDSLVYIRADAEGIQGWTIIPDADCWFDARLEEAVKEAWRDEYSDLEKVKWAFKREVPGGARA